MSAPALHSATPSFDIQQKLLVIDPTTRQQLITNARFFEFKILDLFAGLFDKSYDVATSFVHDSGKRYCVIHSIFGSTSAFGEKLNDPDIIWSISTSDSKFKRECIKAYMEETRCEQDIVYNIVESRGDDEDSD
jgi:hypothetical protein